MRINGKHTKKIMILSAIRKKQALFALLQNRITIKET